MNYELSQRIALAALNMVALQDKRIEAERAFSDAWGQCFLGINPIDNQVGAPMFELIAAQDDDFDNSPREWVYTQQMGAIAGQDCTSDPLWIAQNKAWEARKLARKNAGYAKASLTRLCRAEIKRGEK